MRNLFGKLTVMLLVSAIMGCSYFAAPMPRAHIQIKGPGNQVKEFVVAIDMPTDNDLDLPLSDRYFLNLDLQWLWLEKEDILLLDTDDPRGFIEPLVPWFVLKYRF